MGKTSGSTFHFTHVNLAMYLTSILPTKKEGYRIHFIARFCFEGVDMKVKEIEIEKYTYFSNVKNISNMKSRVITDK